MNSFLQTTAIVLAYFSAIMCILVFLMPKISPSAHTAFYDEERFLALAVWSKQIIDNRTATTAPRDLHFLKG